MPRPLCITWRCALAAALLAGGMPTWGDEAERTREVKAAFVLNIARFVYWPDQVFSDHPEEIHLCLYRDNPLGAALGSIRRKRVAGRNLEVSHIDALDAADGCNILLVPPDQLVHYRTQRQRLERRPLLTITDTTKVPADPLGIQITLVQRGTRIGFDIDQGLVNRSGLRLSSELLKLGRIVNRTP